MRRTIVVVVTLLVLVVPAFAWGAPGDTERASVAAGGGQADGDSDEPSLSPTGRFVVFQSRAENLVAGDTNGWDDIFLRDLAAGSTELISVASDESPADSASSFARVTPDGRHVAFLSSASNLAPKADGALHIFVRDRQSGTTELIDSSSSGTVAERGISVGDVRISHNGRYVMFTSRAENLHPNDDNGHADVFVKDRNTGVTHLLTEGIALDPGNILSVHLLGGVSDNGIAVFIGGGTVLEGTAYTYDLTTGGRTALFDALAVGISANGDRIVADTADFSVLPPTVWDGRAHVVVLERSTGTVFWVDQPPSGARPDGSAAANGRISPSGNIVTFSTNSTNMLAGSQATEFATVVGDPELYPLPRFDGVTRFTDTPTKSRAAASGVATSWPSREQLTSGEVGETRDIFVHEIGFLDAIGSLFRTEIGWLADQAITNGCDADQALFCPTVAVTRAQMASFLARALDLPTVAGNRFNDVTGVHTANINAIAEAGITLGCNPAGTLYCPNSPVTRGQMAAFLFRALD